VRGGVEGYNQVSTQLYKREDKLMAEETLLEQAQALRDELEKASNIDAEKSYLVGSLLSEIVVHATSDEQGEKEPAEKYSDSLRGQVAHFEADHPKIAGMIESLATMLSNLGI